MTVLSPLFLRSVNDTKMATFFRNNFSEDRWRRAALKNAFALMGRQRFDHAAAFFLLAGAVRDAIEVRAHTQGLELQNSFPEVHIHVEFIRDALYATSID